MALLLPVIYAIFLWWFTTGLVVAVYDRSRWLTRVCFLGMTVGMVVSLYGLVLTRNGTDVNAVIIALTCGVIIWGWQVAGYYLNFITGSNTIINEETPLSLRHRFWMALHSGLHHELMALAFALILAVITWDTPNQWGLWVYVALWLMHTSAKLNVFFGVRNFHIEFLPHHMHQVGRLLGKRQSNGFFPLSVIFATSVMLLLVYRGIVPPIDPTQTAGYLSIATLMALGILEHWLLVLPIPSTLYGWGMRALPTETEHKKENVHRMDVSQSVKGHLQ
ncbi:MAG: putative photosynthetic complex assembly protein PuhE [Anaerolineae bacterium]